MGAGEPRGGGVRPWALGLLQMELVVPVEGGPGQEPTQAGDRGQSAEEGIWDLRRADAQGNREMGERCLV